jgi:hypothetical protein
MANFDAELDKFEAAEEVRKQAEYKHIYNKEIRNNRI